MKAKDIRPGVVYAYGTGTYDRYDAVVITDATPDRNDPGDPKFQAIRVVSDRGVITGEVIEALSNPGGSQAARVLAKAGMYADLVTHRMVRGPWIDVMAERDRLHAAIQARRDAAFAEQAEANRLAMAAHEETARKLEALGVVTTIQDDEWGDHPGFYVLGQDAADALIERLGNSR